MFTDNKWSKGRSLENTELNRVKQIGEYLGFQQPLVVFLNTNGWVAIIQLLLCHKHRTFALTLTITYSNNNNCSHMFRKFVFVVKTDNMLQSCLLRPNITLVATIDIDILLKPTITRCQFYPAYVFPSSIQVLLWILKTVYKVSSISLRKSMTKPHFLYALQIIRFIKNAVN